MQRVMQEARNPPNAEHFSAHREVLAAVQRHFLNLSTLRSRSLTIALYDAGMAADRSSGQAGTFDSIREPKVGVTAVLPHEKHADRRRAPENQHGSHLSLRNAIVASCSCPLVDRRLACTQASRIIRVSSTVLMRL